MKRVYSLLIITERLSHGADDGSLGVASKRRLQNACHLTITVVDEAFAISLAQLVNNIGKCKQGPIDVASFSQTQAISMSLVDTLTSGQVYQVKLGNLDLLICGTVLKLALDVDAEHGVTATRGLIKACLCHVADFITLLHVGQHLLSIAHCLLGQFVDVDALNTLANIQILVNRVDQIIDTLVVDLHDWASELSEE